jgi:hypothetical protein
MEVKFTKNHPSGIEKGRIAKIADHIGQKWIDDGYAEEVPEKKSAPAKKAPATKKK